MASTKIRWAKFVIGFSCAFVAFIGANIYSFNEMEKVRCIDCVVKFGFPFSLYIAGGYHGISRLIWGWLLLDVLIALALSVVVGWVVQTVFSRGKPALT